MPTTKLLAISLDPYWTSTLVLEAKHRGFFIDVFSANTLMEAYNLAESHAPQFALVDPEFSNLPEFAMIKTMFAALGTRWMILGADLQLSSASLSSSPDHLNPTEEAIHFITGIHGTKRKLASKIPDVNRIVILGASTGGVEALTKILPQLPRDCAPTVIVQHTGKRFGNNLIDLLNKSCKASVAAVCQGEKLSRGMIRIAAGIENHCHVVQTPEFETQLARRNTRACGHLPSIDELFHSAVPFAHKVLAGLLTGMGNDGTKGLLHLRKAGAKTFCQDKKSSVVYGMPRIAWETGAAQSKVPLELVASHITRNC